MRVLFIMSNNSNVYPTLNLAKYSAYAFELNCRKQLTLACCELILTSDIPALQWMSTSSSIYKMCSLKALCNNWTN